MQKIEESLAGGFSSADRLRISESMDTETWDRKVEDISRIIEDHAIGNIQQRFAQAAVA